jgi:hypothetical protein
VIATESPLKGLRIFLEDTFRPEHLERVIVENGLRKIALAVDTGSGGTMYFYNVVEELKRQNLLDANFFAILAKERGEHKERIRVLERAILGNYDGEEKRHLITCGWTTGLCMTCRRREGAAEPPSSTTNGTWSASTLVTSRSRITT